MTRLRQGLRTALSVVAIAGLPLVASAQTTQEEPATKSKQCLRGLNQLNNELLEADYGMPYPSGYGVRSPNRYATGMGSPRSEIGTVMNAAYIFALNDMGEACLAVMQSARRLAERRGREGERPTGQETLASWRQRTLQASIPVGDVKGKLRMDRVMDADVRNTQAEDLGDIDNVVMDAQNRQIAYVLIGRGGFLGIDETLVAVPWQYMRVVPPPYPDTMVLDVEPSVLEGAPALPNGQAESLLENEEWTQRVDAYWRRHMKG